MFKKIPPPPPSPNRENPYQANIDTTEDRWEGGGFEQALAVIQVISLLPPVFDLSDSYHTYTHGVNKFEVFFFIFSFYVQVRPWYGRGGTHHLSFPF